MENDYEFVLKTMGGISDVHARLWHASGSVVYATFSSNDNFENSHIINKPIEQDEITIKPVAQPAPLNHDQPTRATRRVSL